MTALSMRGHSRCEQSKVPHTDIVCMGDVHMSTVIVNLANSTLLELRFKLG